MRQDTPTLRADAQNKLLGLISSAPTHAAALGGREPPRRARRHDAVDRRDSGGTTQILTRAAQYFQQAIALNAANTNAKENLELVLRLAATRAREVRPRRTERLRLRPRARRHDLRRRLLMVAGCSASRS